MWVRNVVCSVVTLAGAWALGHYWRELGKGLGADQNFTGLGLFAVATAVLLAIVYLIARAVDARAARRRELQD